MNKDYSDIIDLPHHVSRIHKQMPISDRAAQFSPFAALTGHSEAIFETARIIDQKLELDDQQKIMINKQLNDIKTLITQHPMITITYFIHDTKKEGGLYSTITGKVKKINEINQMLILDNNINIQFDDIYNISM